MNKIIYLDLENGISGDMLLGALFDLVDDKKILDDMIEKLGLEDVEIVVTGKKELFRGKDVKVKYDDQPHRTLSEIIDIIENSNLSKWVREKSIEAFKELGKVEADVHDVPLDKVAFHEVGMVDSIVDIVGCLVLFEELDIHDAYCSTVNFGSGTVKCAHGELQVPVPATQNLLKGWNINFSDKEGELVTPTGAVLLKTLTVQTTPPDLNLEKVGIGFGDRETGYPNILRAFYGEISNLKSTINRLTFYIDDMNPEVFSYALEKVRKPALDVYYKQAYGKKSRSGWEVTVTCKKSNMKEVLDLIFKETSTLGMQVEEPKRVVSDRVIKKIETEWGPVRVKISGNRKAPEYDDCKRIAEENDIPLQEVYKEVIRLADGSIN